MLVDEAELLLQPLAHLRGDGAEAALRGLHAQAAQEALGGVALGELRRGKGVAEVRAEVEGAPLRDAQRVGEGVRALSEEALHLRRRLQVQVVVGPDEGQRAVDGGVAFGGDEGVLQPVALRRVVVDVVGGDDGYIGGGGEGGELAVAAGVALQEVLLQLDVDGVGGERGLVLAEEAAGLGVAALREQRGEGAVAAAGEEHEPLGVGGEVDGVEARLAAVDGVGEGEESREVRVALPRPGQQRQPRAVAQGELAAGDGPHVEAAGQPRELQRAAEVGVREGEGGIAVLAGLREELVGVGGPLPKGVEALGVQLHVPGCHAAAPRRIAGTSRPRAGPGRG